ncbi:tyrosine-type recombinase/integrase [Sediminibacillus halophilus]|uniref:Site-specific recombinase XerD n=1 Tax=Sediminibacillus halophilus TaxID=482461 RepID=A0A1G9V187_9BACI|nr:tyrosine-type recombinase/integrase [Sediminibacillus halophilus]SDM66051.1 Site-specific recombinase XerD [Sediminibacillus halophilus]
MKPKTQRKTKYPGVYVDLNGSYFYQTEFGIDRVTGKRVRKKGRKDINGKPFSSAFEANKELIRLKREFHKVNSYANYKMAYGQFMDKVYEPYYKTEVEESTFLARKTPLQIIRNRFDSIPLRDITVEDVQNFRTWLLSSKEDGGNGYSQSYASLVFGILRKSLDIAVEMQYLEYNISKKVKAIGKGKAIVAYWTKAEFEKVLQQIYIGDFYEHLNFVMLWLYYMTGIRVNEGTALWWSDVDLEKRRLRVHNMLILKNKQDWKRNFYTKTEDGKRTIALDNDTVKVLREWKRRQSEIGMGSENDFIFSYDGLPMLKSTISRIIKRYAKLASVKEIQAKGLRHSHASYLINEFNVSVLVLSQRMGHSSPEITLKHYSHMWEGADTVIADEMEGNIKIETAKETQIKFNGNQNLKK